MAIKRLYVLTPPVTVPLGGNFEIVVPQAGRGSRGNEAELCLYNGTRQDGQFINISSKQETQALIADWVTISQCTTQEIRDALNLVANDIETALRTIQLATQAVQQPAAAWKKQLRCTKEGVPHQTINNMILALTNLDPWRSDGCWYDSVRERHMIGDRHVEDEDATEAGIIIEQATEMRVTNLALVGRALDYLCRQTSRDLLQEWVDTLPLVAVSPLLTTWLRTYARVPALIPDDYVADVSRQTVVGIIARILHPGCQFRCVPILEGDQNAGKSELTRELAGKDAYGRSWHVALSANLEGKEAHMMLDGALVAELEELSSYGKTDANRMKALVSARTDSFVPKFANKRVDHPRRTVFIGTMNPEGDGAYFKDQSGNTRYLPLTVGQVDLTGFLNIRTQLFAEAKAYVLAHPYDWWQLENEADAQNEREIRRQPSVYEGRKLEGWLQRCGGQCTWEDIAELCFQIPPERWNRTLQMEIGKALRAFKWRPGHSGNHRYWVPA